MARKSLKVSPEKLQKVKRAFDSTGYTQPELANEVGLSTRQPIGKFLSGRAIDHSFFKEICFKLGLVWKEVADLPRDVEPDSEENKQVNVEPQQESPNEETTPDQWYLAHPYGMPPNFTGRIVERQMLSQWLNEDSQHPLLVVRALGGFGKSALAWHWLLHDVNQTQWRRVIWWSFYESDAGFDNFLRATLIHLFNYNKPDLSPRQQAETLVNNLVYDTDNALLILDGFERELRAFSGMNAAYQGDEIGQVDSTDNERDCISSVAEYFLHRIASLPGRLKVKVLMTTRLRPRVLEVTGGDLLVGCREKELNQMLPDDAVAYCRARGVCGNQAEIMQACANYGYHPLSISLLAGLIVEDLQQPGNIAAARRLDVSGDLVQRRHHVLEQAYEGLTSVRRQLLSRIACFRNPVAYDALRTLIEEEDNNNFDAHIKDLLSRGLLQRDRRTNRYDLHPIVRHYAYDRLRYTARNTAHRQLQDYFAAVRLPERVHSLDHLAPLIELYHHTVQAKQYDEAFNIFCERIHEATYFQFGAYQLQIDLLEALLPDSKNRLPKLKNESSQAWVLNELANSYALSGQPLQAIRLMERQNTIQWELGSQTNLAIGLGNLSNHYRDIGKLQAAETKQRQRIALCQENFKDIFNGLVIRDRRELKSLTKTKKDRFNEAVGHQDLGLLLAYRGAWAEAEEELAKALALFEKEKAISSCGVVWAYRAVKALLLTRVTAPPDLQDKDTEQDVNSGATALVAANQALRLADETANTLYSHERDYVRAYWLLGAAHRVNGNIEEANHYLSEALTRCRGINLVSLEANILLELARLQLSTREQDEALHLAQEALNTTQRCGYILPAADLHLLLAQIAVNEKDKQTALLHVREAHRLATCDGVPNYTYKVAYDDAETLLSQLEQMKTDD